MTKPPPDRACAHRSSPHFSVLARYVLISLDGVVQKGVIEYCKSEGWIRRLVEDGDKWKIAEDGQNLVEETVHGNVELEWKV